MDELDIFYDTYRDGGTLGFRSNLLNKFLNQKNVEFCLGLDNKWYLGHPNIGRELSNEEKNIIPSLLDLVQKDVNSKKDLWRKKFLEKLKSKLIEMEHKSQEKNIPSEVNVQYLKDLEELKFKYFFENKSECVFEDKLTLESLSCIINFIFNIRPKIRNSFEREKEALWNKYYNLK